MDEFLIRALAAGLGIASIAGPLGCFVVWRRMAYFGATLSHAALLGVALGFLLDISLQLGILLIAVLVSLALFSLQKTQRLSNDTLLGIAAHGSLALGLIVLSSVDSVRVDLLTYLFGDILAVSSSDVIWIFAGALVCLVLLIFFWRVLLSITAHEELARVDGVAVEKVQLLFLLLVSTVIAVAMQIVGLLLIVSMLIIPAAIARSFSSTPEQMAIGAALAGAIAVFIGLWASLQWDTPAGPSIVAVATGLFALSLIYSKKVIRGSMVGS